MSDSGPYKHFLASFSEFIIATVLMIFGYLYKPLELIEKYKNAMPNEIGLLMLSTGIFAFLAPFMLIQLNKRRTNQKTISDRGFAALFVLVILSISFCYQTFYALQTAFLLRKDPLFDYFFENYKIYAIGYFGLVFIISYILDMLLRPEH